MGISYVELPSKLAKKSSINITNADVQFFK